MAMIESKLDASKKRLHLLVEEDVTSTHVMDLKAAFHKIIESSAEADWSALYLDLRNCRLIDSKGLNWLFAENLRLKEMEKTFVVRISSPAIHRVMQFAGFDKQVVLKFRRRKQYRD